ncbi:MAG: ABC transporter substrate-binding protein [Acholeplasmataceae bacterium]
MKKIVLGFLMLVFVVVLAACQNTLPNLDVEEYDVPEVPAGLVQGVTDNGDGTITVKVGNTASKSGLFGVVGIPFSAAIDSVFQSYNATSTKYKIEYITYDDQTQPDVGLTNTKKLIEDDKVFALVGHVGTGTVGATLPTILDAHIPMVYAATGINELYFGNTPGNPVFAVQPIYKTDGRIAYARAISESLFGESGDEKLAENARIYVLYTNDDAGKSITAGIIEEARNNGRERYLTVNSFEEGSIDSAVKAAIAKNPALIIVAGNQAPFNSALVALNDNGNTAPVITSYVNTNASSITAMDYDFDFYGSAWLDVTTEEGLGGYLDFFAIMTANGYGAEPDSGKENYTGNAFAMAGYVAAKVFLAGLDRVEGELTFLTYIQALESAPVNIPMGGEIDFTDGKRWGINSMSFLKYEYNAETKLGEFVKVAEIESLEEILNKK